MQTLRSPSLGPVETRPSDVVRLPVPYRENSESLGKVVSEQVTEGLGTLRGPCAGAKLGADDQQKRLSQGDREGDTKRAKHSPRPGKAKNM